MTTRAEIKALARCARKAARSADGRAHRGARVECANALRKLGTGTQMADAMARAMVRVGQRIQQVATTKGLP